MAKGEKVEYSKEVKEDRKKEIFDSMGPRNQKRIMKKGYDEWNPFEDPKDPMDIRQDDTKRTIQELIRDFLRSGDSEDYSEAYGAGAFEMAMGVVNKEERIRGMFDFACWYDKLLKKEGLKKD